MSTLLDDLFHAALVFVAGLLALASGAGAVAGWKPGGITALLNSTQARPGGGRASNRIYSP